MAYYEINFAGKCVETCFLDNKGSKGELIDKCEVGIGVIFEKWCNMEQLLKGDDCEYTIL